MIPLNTLLFLLVISMPTGVDDIDGPFGGFCYDFQETRCDQVYLVSSCTGDCHLDWDIELNGLARVCEVGNPKHGTDAVNNNRIGYFEPFQESGVHFPLFAGSKPVVCGVGTTCGCWQMEGPDECTDVKRGPFEVDSYSDDFIPVPCNN